MIFRFEDVTKVYKANITALKKVSFTVNEGEFFFMVGPSGAGKSTIIRLLTRQELPNQGQIFFEDINVTKLPRRMLSIYRQQLGIVFQDLKLLPSMTVRENIQFALEITNKSPKEMKDTANYLLNAVGLEKRADLFPAALSGGEKQRAAIARALANDPKLFIADEPTGNLDPQTSLEIIELLKAVNSWGTTVMVVTHDDAIVDLMQTRVIQMSNGEIVGDRKGGYHSAKEKRPESLEKYEAKVEAETKAEEDEDKKEFIGDLGKLNISSKIQDKLTNKGIYQIEDLLDKSDSELSKIGLKKNELKEIDYAIEKMIK